MVHTGWIFIKFDVTIFRKYIEKIRGASKSGKNKDLSIFMIISRSTLLRTRNVSDKNCRENQNTHQKHTFYVQ